jgi:hypothetical protein
LPAAPVVQPGPIATSGSVVGQVNEVFQALTEDLRKASAKKKRR